MATGQCSGAVTREKRESSEREYERGERVIVQEIEEEKRGLRVAVARWLHAAGQTAQREGKRRERGWRRGGRRGREEEYEREENKRKKRRIRKGGVGDDGLEWRSGDDRR